MKTTPLTRGFETVARKLAKLRLSRAAVLLAAALALPLTAAAAAVPVVQEWYVPQPEAQLREDYLVLAPATNAICDSVIAVTVSVAGTRIVYDQWEDGYEADLSNPTQATTQIWGDGNNANGKPPGYANDPASFTAGAVILLRNNVTLPRNPATILYDGRDRLGSTYGIVMTRAGWFTAPGPLLANSVEVRAVPDWGSHFELPVGEDFIFPTPLTSSMFEHCSAYIMAAANGTVVTIDVNGPAVVGGVTTVTLNQGESYLVNSGLKTQAFIDSTKPIQVIEFFGDIGGNYESRGANIPPTNKWSDDYYAPVGTAADGEQTYVFLHNPNDTTAITVNYVTQVGSGSFTIQPESTHQFLMPQNSAAHFTSVGNMPFWGIGTVGANPSANNVHDWGYSLVPKAFLSTEISVGWGAGSSDGTQNGNPVWVTATRATTLYVDLLGDHLGAGGTYDYTIPVAPLAVTRIYDNVRKDQSAMRIYTVDGTLLTGAWGQDPAVAGPGLPYLDLGNTLPNYPVPVLAKTSRKYNNGGVGPIIVGDVLEYTLELDNRSLFSLSAIGIVDTLPSQVSYVAGSTIRDGGAVADAANPTTAFPLDEGGLVVPILQANASTVITFRATITTAGTIINTANVVGAPGVVATDTVVVSGGSGATNCTLKLTDSGGSNTITTYLPGAAIYVSVTDNDSNTSSGTVETMTAVVSSTVTSDSEIVTLTETGVNTGIFLSAALPTSTGLGAGLNDGTLKVAVGSTVSATRVDSVHGDQCNGSATIVAASGLSKPLYLSDPSQALDRVDPANVSPADTTTSQTAVLGGSSGGAVTLDSVTTNTGTTASITVSHTTGTGSNRLMLISAGNFNGATVSSVVVNGVTLVAGTNRVGVTTSSRVEIWKVLNPTAGTYNIVVTFSGTMDKGACVGVTTFSGVDQTTALGAFNSATASGSATVNIVSAVGDLVFSSATCEGATAPTTVDTPLWRLATTEAAHGGSTKTATTTSTAMAWTHAGSCMVAGVAIKPAATSGTATATFTQAPAFAGAFSLTSAPTVTAYYTVSSGSMPASPSISAVLKKNGTAFATSNSAAASGGLLTFGFPTLGSPVSFVATDVISLDITTTQTGVSFTVDYDSSSKPSKITLPTSTVIHADTVTVYDAPYPGGSVVTTPTVGQTLYVRATVGDPFGAYDVTSANVVIDGPGTAGDISSAAMTHLVAAATTSSKTFEYAWTTGTTEGNFSVTVTAKEGFENVITSTKATAVSLTALDLGTPSTTEFTLTSNGTGTETYAGNATVSVRVTDLDQNTNPAVAETVTVVVTSSSGDSETITLTETGVNTGVFVGTLPASAATVGTSNNGTLYAPLGAALVVNYVDPTDATDTSSDAATVPNTVPAVSVQKTLLSPADGQIIGGEAAQYRLRVTNTGNLALNTVHVVDTYPSANLTYVSATPSPTPDPPAAPGTLIWDFGSLAAGASTDIIVNFTGLAAAATVTNTVNVTTTTTGGANPSASATKDIIVTRPAVSVTKTLVSPNPGPANKGDNVVFSISVQNTGTTVITTLPLEDLYSAAYFDFVSATVTPDATGSGSLLWNDVTGAGSLAVNAAFTVSVTLRAKGAATLATNTAAVNYAVDANTDPVPPANSPAGLETKAASIAGYVYSDQGTPGFGGDVALPAVTVKLYSDPNGDGDPADGAVVATTTTDAAGYYEFLNLGVAHYVVVQVDLLGYSSVADTAGANDNRVPVNVTTLTSYPNNNFLDIIVSPATFGSIAGQVRNDTNANGNFADADSGLAGATLTLYSDPNGDGDPSDGLPIGSAVTTTSSGTYSFADVPAGNYVVVETDPSGYVSTADGVGANNNQIPVTVVASTAATGKDFLDTLFVAGTIGDLVWLDTNNSGTYDSGTESGINAVTVELYLSSQTPGVSSPYMTATTAGGGLYSFSNVPFGSYVVYIPALNFASGQALVSSPLSSTITNTSDDAINNDDNGIQIGGSGTGVVSPVIVLTAGESDLTKDFGLVPNSFGTVSGTVSVDTTGDTTADGTLAGATVSLYGDTNSDGIPDGAVISTQVTGSNGAYSFTSLPPGSYVVVESDPTGSVSISDGDSTTPGDDLSNTSLLDNRVPVTLTGGEGDTGNDFLDRATAAIGDSVWLDENGNGLQDAGEAGIPNLAVTLTGTDASGNTVSRATMTDTNGAYLFAYLPPSNGTGYAITVTPTTGLNATFNEDTGTVGPNNVSTVVLTGAQHITADFGYNWAPTSDVTGGTNTGAIGDRVWIDADGDGVQDPGEPGLDGVTVQLWYDSNNDGTIDAQLGASATTAADGSYVFDGLSKGIYEVRVTGGTTGYSQTGDPDHFGTTGTNDNKTTVPVILAPGDVFVNADFGYQPATSGTISGTVWFDANANANGPAGTPGGSDAETTIAGVSVALIKDSNGNGTWDTGELIIATTVTDAAGNYSFTGLTTGSSGDYLVWVNDTGNVLTDLKEMYDSNGVITPNLSSVLDLTTGGDSAQDFGYTPLAQFVGGGLIGDTVYLDRNGNGSQDLDGGDNILGTADDEPGLEGVTVQLWNSGETTLLSTTLTDENGRYAFGGLAGSTTYVVKVLTSTLPGGGTGMTNTGDPNGGADSKSSVAIASGGISLVQDFGYHTTTANTISGSVWNDANADGTLYGETGGYAGVTVVLKDSAGNVIGTAITAASGNYSFPGLPNGTYTVDVTDSANVLNGLWRSNGTNPGADNNSQTDPYTVAVTGGQANSTADFGYFGSFAALGDWVWHDTNADGVQDFGSEGEVGVVVQLSIAWPNSGGTTFVTTATAGGGYYRFDNLLLDENLAGTGGVLPTYSITATTPGGHTASPTDQGGNDALDSDPAGVAAFAARGFFHSDYDFGFHGGTLYSITGTVLADSTGTGVINNPGDTPLAGVEIRLYLDLNGNGLADDVLVGLHATDSQGYYSFTGLPASVYNYLVVEVNPVGATSVTDRDGDFNGNGTDRIAVLLTTADSTGNDFLDTTAATLSAISGTVYDDGGFGVPGDGAFGADAAVPGVILRLYRDLNNDGLATTNELVAATATNFSGGYSFGSLPNGAYLVIETDPDGATSVRDTEGTLTDNKIAVTLAGSPIGGNDFLDDSGTSTNTYTVSGTVYNDANHDWAFGGDTALETVTVRLYADLNNNGVVDSGFDVWIDTKTTNASGYYAFVNLPDGDYLVVETDPTGYNSVTDSGEPDAANDNNTIDVRVSGGDSTGNNFLDFLQHCPDTWAAWTAEWGIVNTNYTGNPDGDRYTNLVEYAFCLPPNSGIGKPFCLEWNAGTGTLDGVYHRTAGGTTDVFYTLQKAAVLGNPTSWTDDTDSIMPPAASLTVINNGDGTETVRISDIEALTSLTGEGFVRIKVNIGANIGYTEVLGWTQTTLNKTCNTFNNPYLRCSSFTGTVDSPNSSDPAGRTLNFVTSMGPALNLRSVIVGPNLGDTYADYIPNSYYLEVTTGSYEGHRFDIDSVPTATSVLLAADTDLDSGSAPFNTLLPTGDPAALPSLAGAKVIIRRHWQLGVQFPATGFDANADPKLSDQVQIYANGAWTTHCVYNDPGKIWKILNGAASGGTVLPPGQGMFVSKPQSVATVLMYGEVRQNAFIRPLQITDTAGTRANLVGGGFPIGQSANAASPTPYAYDREMALGAANVGFFGSRDFKLADSFFIWRGDATVPPAVSVDGYDTYYLFASPTGAPTIIRWVKVGDVNLAEQQAQTLFLSDRSVFIRVKNALPSYTMPCPWTP